MFSLNTKKLFLVNHIYPVIHPKEVKQKNKQYIHICYFSQFGDRLLLSEFLTERVRRSSLQCTLCLEDTLPEDTA